MAKNGSGPNNEEVAALVLRIGLTHPELATALNRAINPARALQPYVIGRMISGARKVKADEMDALRRLADGANLTQSVRQSFSPQLTEHADTVPLFSARGGRELTLGEENRVGASPIHPSQRGYVSAFNFIQPDDAMGDLIRRGFTGHAVRDLPPLQGMPVLVEKVDGTVVARIYLGEDAQTVFVRALKGKTSEEKLPRREVKGLHRVTGVTFAGS